MQKICKLIKTTMLIVAAFGCGAFFALTAVFVSNQSLDGRVTVAIIPPRPDDPVVAGASGPAIEVWALATAAPPLPLPSATATAVAPSLPIVMPMTRAEMYAETGYWFYAAPADWYGGEMTYCHDVQRNWTAEEQETTRRGFEGWVETGIAFREVPYSTVPTECLVLVKASDDPGRVEAGQGQMGITYGVQAWIWSNTAVLPYNHYIVMHEVGHVFNLDHDPGPNLMNEYVQYVDTPTAENIAQARAYWFGLD